MFTALRLSRQCQNQAIITYGSSSNELERSMAAFKILNACLEMIRGQSRYCMQTSPWLLTKMPGRNKYCLPLRICIYYICIYRDNRHIKRHFTYFKCNNPSCHQTFRTYEGKRNHLRQQQTGHICIKITVTPTQPSEQVGSYVVMYMYIQRHVDTQFSWAASRRENDCA